jgi:hypothetical protein
LPDHHRLEVEKEFKCEGIENLADFKAVIEELNGVDPGFYRFRLPVDPHAHASFRDFVKKMDALLELLDSTADALAAEWDMRSGGPTEANENGGGFKPTIQ